MSIPTDRDLLVKAAENLLNVANGFETLNLTLARRLGAAVINDKSFGVDHISRVGMIVDSLAAAPQPPAGQQDRCEVPDDEDESDCMFTPTHADFERRQIFAGPSLLAAARRVFEVMGHDHQTEWDDCTSAQKEFYVCVAKAALGVAHG